MTIKCKAAVIRKNDCEKPYANSKPLSIEDICEFLYIYIHTCVCTYYKFLNIIY